MSYTTQIQQVWELLHKNGTLTSKQVASVLEISDSSASSQLTVLFRRKQVVRESTSYYNEDARKCVLYKYSAAGDKYKSGWDLHVAAKRKHRKATAMATQADLFEIPPAAPEPIVAPVINGHKAAVIDIENMTVREARAVYERLKGFFGNI
jgi:hypothetical protein